MILKDCYYLVFYSTVEGKGKGKGKRERERDILCIVNLLDDVRRVDEI